MNVMSRAEPCARCAPSAADMQVTARTLYLWPPAGHVWGKVQKALGRLDLSWSRTPCGTCLVIHDDPDGLFLMAAPDVLTQAEIDDTRVLTLDGPECRPGLADFARIMTLSAAAARSRNAWLADVIADGRVTTLFQPIVSARAPHAAVAHECLLRGIDTDGGLIPAGRLLDAARAGHLLFPLDRLARETAVRRAAEEGLEGPMFINFSPSSVYDPATCLRTTIKAVEEARIPRDHVVFEVTETDKVEDPDHLARLLTYYREAGFRVALDDVGAGWSSLDLLARLRPDFLKIDMHLVRGVATDRFKAAIVGRLITLGSELDIEVIAEGIETEEDRDWLMRTGADYLQGYLFGRPAAHPRKA